MSSLINAAPFEIVSLWVILCIALLGLAYALLLRKQVMKCDKGTDKMQEAKRPVSGLFVFSPALLP